MFSISDYVFSLLNILLLSFNLRLRLIYISET